MRHIVFIDDQTAILSGLERLLSPMRQHWRMTFVSSPSQALEVLSEDPADVVISDMRMPDLDGAALLREIRSRWPDTVRIILSGYSDEGAAMRSVPVAHRFLAKPCDTEMLLNAVRESCDLQDRLARPELRRLVGGLGVLPSPPSAYTAITEALSQPEVQLRRVAGIVCQDPSLAAKVLQLVNSAFFGLPRAVTRIDEAVAYLGISRLRDLVLAAEVEGMFQSPSRELAHIAKEVNDAGKIIGHAARQLVRPRHGHDAFIAGVLHDIGRLVLATIVPREYNEIEQQRRAGGDLVHLETERLGASHTDVGAYLLRLWGLPLTLVDAVARHHDEFGSETGENPVVVAVARAAAEAAEGSQAMAVTSEVRSG